MSSLCGYNTTTSNSNLCAVGINSFLSSLKQSLGVHSDWTGLSHVFIPELTDWPRAGSRALFRFCLSQFIWTESGGRYLKENWSSCFKKSENVLGEEEI